MADRGVKQSKTGKLLASPRAKLVLLIISILLFLSNLVANTFYLGWGISEWIFSGVLLVAICNSIYLWRLSVSQNTTSAEEDPNH